MIVSLPVSVVTSLIGIYRNEDRSHGIAGLALSAAVIAALAFVETCR